MPDLPDPPRVRLLDGPTPLQPMPRLSAALADRAELWVKREDLGPLAFSGNKLRNLEFLLGAAIAKGADTIVTSGRRWSNHCRLTAAAGARLGMRVEIIVSGPRVRSVNLELIEELGATVHQAHTDERAEREGLVTRVADAARAAGRRVEVIPIGGSAPAGAWGQVLAALEVTEQAGALGFEPDAIVLPTATGGTQAGLVVGAALSSSTADPDGARLARSADPSKATTTDPMRIAGVVVAHAADELRPSIEVLVEALAGMARVEAPLDRIELVSSQAAAGYGVPSPASAAAARLLATTEGLFVDPIYTAKGLAGLIELVLEGRLDGQRVIFWHGGGLPALFESPISPPSG